MFIDRNMSIEYRTHAVNEILRSCGLEGSFVTYRGRDYLCVIKNMFHNDIEIGLEGFKDTIKTDDEVYLVLTIDGKRYSMKVRVTTMKPESEKIICNMQIIMKLPLDLKTHLENIADALETINARRFDRIYCNEKTLENFDIDQKFRILFPEREYSCFIKNISINGIAFLTTEDFSSESSEKYILAINFKNPAENLHIAGKLVRRLVIEIDGTNFVDCAMQLENNIFLNKRIMSFLKSGQILKYTLRKSEL